MIVDRIENVGLYTGLSAKTTTGLEFLAQLDRSGFSEHREAIDGTEVFAIFESYATRLQNGQLFETHDQHIDIQYVLSGREQINVALRGDVEVHTAYDPQKDVTWYEPGEALEIVLKAGWFAILYPHEAHLPQLAVGSPSEVQKVVIKVRV